MRDAVPRSSSDGGRRNRIRLGGGLLPLSACKGTVLRQETEEPRGLAAPARPGLVSTGSNWRKGRGLENGKPRLPSDARPDALGRRDHAEHRR